MQTGGREVRDCKAEGNYSPKAWLPQGEASGSHHRRRQREGRGFWRGCERERKKIMMVRYIMRQKTGM